MAEPGNIPEQFKGRWGDWAEWELKHYQRIEASSRGTPLEVRIRRFDDVQEYLARADYMDRLSQLRKGLFCSREEALEGWKDGPAFAQERASLILRGKVKPMSLAHLKWATLRAPEVERPKPAEPKSEKWF